MVLRVAFPDNRVKSLIEFFSPMLYLAAPSVLKAELQPDFRAPLNRYIKLLLFLIIGKTVTFGL